MYRKNRKNPPRRWSRPLSAAVARAWMGEKEDTRPSKKILIIGGNSSYIPTWMRRFSIMQLTQVASDLQQQLQSFHPDLILVFVRAEEPFRPTKHTHYRVQNYAKGGNYERRIVPRITVNRGWSHVMQRAEELGLDWFRDAYPYRIYIPEEDLRPKPPREQTRARSMVNVRRAMQFESQGITAKDINYAKTSYILDEPGHCSLCGTAIRYQFRLMFDRPDEPQPIIFFPVGSVCIKDWVEALPDSPKKSALLRELDAELGKAEEAQQQKKKISSQERRAKQRERSALIRQREEERKKRLAEIKERRRAEREARSKKRKKRSGPPQMDLFDAGSARRNPDYDDEEDLPNTTRVFTYDELDTIAQDAVLLQNKLLSGKISIDRALETMGGDISIGESNIVVEGPTEDPVLVEYPGPIEIKVEGGSFDNYSKWVRKTWKVDRIVTKFVETMLGLPHHHNKPIILPAEDGTYIMRCQICNNFLTAGGIVINYALRCSPNCRDWGESSDADPSRFTKNPDRDIQKLRREYLLEPNKDTLRDYANSAMRAGQIPVEAFILATRKLESQAKSFIYLRMESPPSADSSFHLSPCFRCALPSWQQPCPWCGFYPMHHSDYVKQPLTREHFLRRLARYPSFFHFYAEHGARNRIPEWRPIAELIRDKMIELGNHYQWPSHEEIWDHYGPKDR